MTTQTEALKVLGEKLDEHEKALNAALEQRANETEAAVKASLEKSIDEIRDRIGKMEKSRDQLERVSPSGIEYAKNGEEGAFSLWRAMQLSAQGAQKQAHVGRGSDLWNAKSHGYEVEVIKQTRAGLEGLDPQIKASMNVGSDAAGGVFVPTTVFMDSVIAELEPATTIYPAGARRMDGLVGNFEWIVDEGGTSAFYIDTEAEQAAASSQNTFSTLKAIPHTMSANTHLTRGARRQTAVAMEAFVRQTIGRKFGIREDKTAFVGTGASSEPRGITNAPGLLGTNWSGTDFAGADQTTTNKLREMVYKPRIANYTNPAGSWAFVQRPEVSQKLANVKDADGRTIFVGDNQGLLANIMGTRVLDTTNVDLTTGNAFMLYGDFSQVLMLHWGVMEFRSGYINDNQTKDVLTVTAFMDHDVLVTRGEAFVLASNFDEV